MEEKLSFESIIRSKTNRIYLSPYAYVFGKEALELINRGEALPVNGKSSHAFTFLRVFIEDETRVSSLTLSVPAFLSQKEKFSEVAASQINYITSPQKVFAGLDLKRPQIMGILNATPDSFSDGGLYCDVNKAVSHAVAMNDDGASIIDVGGESMRPFFAEEVSVLEEIKRVIPVIEKLKKAGFKVSIDSRKFEVIKEAVLVGADIINDISALADDRTAELAAEKKLPVILMHMQGKPQDMQKNPIYKFALTDVYNFLQTRITKCEAFGINRNNICIDLGIGFGKNLSHNLGLMNNVGMFLGLGTAVLMGTSRKSFIKMASKDEPADKRLAGSLVSAVSAVSQGANIIRVHDTFETMQALRIDYALKMEDKF